MVGKKTYLQPGPGPEGEYLQQDMDRDFCRNHCNTWVGHRKKGDPGWCGKTYFVNDSNEDGSFWCSWSHEKKVEVLRNAAMRKKD